MADVQPFSGIRYNSEKVGDLSQVVTPPYDVISPEAQATYYERNPYNVIRLELGREEPGDTSLNNQYSRAAETLAEWRLDGTLQQDNPPCYYLYQQIFSHDWQTYTRTSLLARVRLEPWEARVVLPHEHTLAKPKDDRLKLLRACATNLSPIMSLYDDPQGRIRRLLTSYATNPAVQFTDEANEEHCLHPITDPQQIAQIADFFAERQLYIADGHHRYETALNYRNEILEQRHELFDADAANFVMMALTDVDDPGLLVLPTHRILFDLNPDALASLSTERLSQYFTVHELETGSENLLEQLAEAGKTAPSFIVHTPKQTWLLTVNEQGKTHMEASGHSEAWNELDVAIAHRLLLEDILELTAEDVSAGTHVRYLRDAQQALQAVQNNRAQVALLLNATGIRQMTNVAKADDRMPQKSTYFYPKLITGLVFNPLW